MESQVTETVAKPTKLNFGLRTKKVFLANQNKFYELMFWSLMLGFTGLLQNRAAYICLALFVALRFGLYVAWEIFVYELKNWEGSDPFAEGKK